jgi:hypothetical protein
MNSSTAMALLVPTLFASAAGAVAHPPVYLSIEVHFTSGFILPDGKGGEETRCLSEATTGRLGSDGSAQWTGVCAELLSRASDGLAVWTPCGVHFGGTTSGWRELFRSWDSCITANGGRAASMDQTGCFRDLWCDDWVTLECDVPMWPDLHGFGRGWDICGAGGCLSMSGHLPAIFTFCRTDFNADGTTDFGDAADLFIRWGMGWGDIGPGADRVDLDADGIITTGDLALLLLDMGVCPATDA